MEDMNTRLRKLLADADDCELIGNLAEEPKKRAAFRRMAGQFRQMAAELKGVIDARMQQG